METDRERLCSQDKWAWKSAQWIFGWMLAELSVWAGWWYNSFHHKEVREINRRVYRAIGLHRWSDYSCCVPDRKEGHTCGRITSQHHLYGNWCPKSALRMQADQSLTGFHPYKLQSILFNEEQLRNTLDRCLDAGSVGVFGSWPPASKTFQSFHRSLIGTRFSSPPNIQNFSSFLCWNLTLHSTRFIGWLLISAQTNGDLLPIGQEGNLDI